MTMGRRKVKQTAALLTGIRIPPRNIVAYPVLSATHCATAGVVAAGVISITGRS